MTANKTLAQLAKKVKIGVRHGARLAWEKQDDWQTNANGYRVALRYQGRTVALSFWMGTGIEREPEAADVLDCLLSDATSEGVSFEEWCREYGYDTDSRANYRTFRACLRMARKVRHLLGSDYELFQNAER